MTMADIKEENTFRPGVLTLTRAQVLLNFLVANIWIGPIVTVYWVSTWQLIITVLIFPNDIYTSIWISFAIAVGVVFVASCAQVLIYRFANAYGIVRREVCSQLYIYILAFASVNQWRCFWHGWDTCTSSTTTNGVATFLGAFLVMALLRCSATLMAAPGVTNVDVPPVLFFVLPTYARTEPGTFKHVLDSLFTASFVPFLVATVWRGFWVICDRNLSPGDITVSACYNLVIAYGLGGILILTRAQWIQLCVWAGHKHVLWKYLVEQTHMLLQTVCAISHWRGFWTLFLNHVLFDITWRYWLGHALAFILMSACLGGKSLLTAGCIRDGIHPNGLGIDIDIYFVSRLWHYWKQKRYSVLDEDNDTTVMESSNAPEKTGLSGGAKNEQTPVLSTMNVNEKATRYVIEN